MPTRTPPGVVSAQARPRARSPSPRSPRGSARRAAGARSFRPHASRAGIDASRRRSASRPRRGTWASAPPPGPRPDRGPRPRSRTAQRSPPPRPGDLVRLGATSISPRRSQSQSIAVVARSSPRSRAKFSAAVRSIASISSGNRSIPFGEPVGERGVAEPAVAAAGPERDRVALQEHDVARRILLLGLERGPQAGEPAAHDHEVRVAVRPRAVAWARARRVGRARRARVAASA